MTQLFGQLRQVTRAFTAGSISFDLDLVPLRFDGLPLKKVANWFRTEVSVGFKPSMPWGFPTILQVEPVSRCNLGCRICPVATGLGRPPGEMDLGLFRSIVDQTGEYLLLLMFWDWGEPFLNPTSYEMIRYARRAGVKVVSSTNGHIFAEGEHAREVVESGLDVLVFSVDGVDQGTYQHFRERGKLDAVLQGIRRVVGEKRRLGSSTPLVNLRFIVMKHSEHQIPQLSEFARQLGVDVLTLRKFHFVPGTGPDKVQTIVGRSFLPSESKYQLPAIPPGGFHPVRISRNPCRNLWNCPTIHWDGTVCSCFMDYSERRPLGSLQRSSFREIWYGGEYRELRRRFRKAWRQLPLCGECACGFEGGDVGREANAEAFSMKEAE